MVKKDVFRQRLKCSLGYQLILRLIGKANTRYDLQ